MLILAIVLVVAFLMAGPGMQAFWLFILALCAMLATTLAVLDLAAGERRPNDGGPPFFRIPFYGLLALFLLAMSIRQMLRAASAAQITAAACC